MYIEIHNPTQLTEHWERERSLHCVVCQNLDLKGETEFLLTVEANGAVFLGCQFEATALKHILETCGLVFPRLSEHLDLPFEPYRHSLYVVPELMAGFDPKRPASFADTIDGQIYDRFQKYRGSDDQPTPILEALAQRIHDHSIDDVLYEFLLEHKHVVGIMGGHRMVRGEQAYHDIAWLARELTRSNMLVVTGGGPGAMEAANLGAWLAPYNDHALDVAINVLSPSPSFDDDPGNYIAHGYKVLDRIAGTDSPNDSAGAPSLAVPTWFYGHEPTNVFSTHIAKYFANSIREDGLVGIATRGIVFAPGKAGTLQEIFQDATQNYYGICKVISPMVLFGVEYWTKELPVLQILQRLGAGKTMGELIALEDDPERIVEFLKQQPPVDAKD
jgi:predicted Rossmann-fold nucleotide-binding protein